MFEAKEVVRRWLGGGPQKRSGAGGGRPRGGAWARCEAEREFLEAKLASRHMGRRLRLTKIRKLLRRERGVDVPYSTLYRFATRELGFGKAAPTIPVADGEPGKE